MSSLFIWAGYNKLFVFGPAGTAKYFASVHIPVPDIAAWVVIVIEILGGVLIFVGLPDALGRAHPRNFLSDHRLRRSSADRGQSQYDPISTRTS